MDFSEAHFSRCSHVGLLSRAGLHDELSEAVRDVKVPIDAPDNRGWHPIHEAAFAGHPVAVQLLVQAAVARELDRYVDSRTHNNETALLIAAQRGNFDVMRVLLEAGADANAASNEEMFPLMAVLTHHSIPMVELLIAHGASVNKVYFNGWTLLHEAVHRDFDDVIELLPVARSSAEAELHLAARDDDGLTPIFVAAQYGRTPILKRLLSFVKDASARRHLVNVCAQDGASPVYIASQEGYLGCVRQLIADGADVNRMTNDDCIHPVVPAIRASHTQCLKLLLANCSPADLNLSAEDPLMHAVECAAGYECVSQLIEHGVSLERTSKQTLNVTTSHELLKPLFHRPQITPLGRAIMRQKYDICQLLVSAGAQTVYSTADVQNPLVLAVNKRQCPKLLLLLIQSRVPIGGVSDNSRCSVPDAVLAALHPCFIDQLRLLLQAGVRPSLSSWCGCGNGQSDYSLISELCSLYSRAHIGCLLRVCLQFSCRPLPRCCQPWRDAVDGYSGRHWMPDYLSPAECDYTPVSLYQQSSLSVLRSLPAHVLLARWHRIVNQLALSDTVKLDLHALHSGCETLKRK